MNVAAVVLAAGRSTRMGGNKLLMEVSGKPLVRHAVEAALASKARPIIVVTGHEREAIEQCLAGYDVRRVHNIHFADGLSTSLNAGIAALPAESAGAIVLLGDMPRISALLIDRLLEAFQSSPDSAAIVPVHAGLRGNPVLIARRLFDRVARLGGDRGAGQLLKNHPDVIEIPWHDEGVSIDVDTPMALDELRRKP